MSQSPVTLFHPVEGAALDLESLMAISSTAERTLGAALGLLWPGRGAWPGVGGLVLWGFEPDGAPVAGQPGTVRPARGTDEWSVGPGAALVTGRDGRRMLLELREPARVRWPTKDGPAAQAALVLMAQTEAGQVIGGAPEPLPAARLSARPHLAFVKPETLGRDLEEQSFLLPLAVAVGNAQDWATDLRRIWQPDHPSNQALIRRLDDLAIKVWRARPEGSPWDRHVLGDNWVRYQTVAASTLEATRAALVSRPTSTLDRVRALGNALERLQGTVEPVATELMQVLGGAGAQGPYRELLARARREAT